MARQAKPYEEARKDAEAFFRGDSLRTEVFLSRYALRALDGHGWKRRRTGCGTGWPGR